MIQSDVQLDAKGLACPMPIVKTKKMMATVEEGQVLEVQATDKGSVADLAAWSKTTGHQYIGSKEENGVFYHYIRKGNLETIEAIDTPFEKTISNEEVVQAEGVLLDVREQAEYSFGHIQNAKNIPLGELNERMNELNKDEFIYVICRTGTRSDLAAKQLAQAGFTNVFNVLPGMSQYDGELQKTV